MLDCIVQECNCFFTFILSFISLGGFNVDFPVEFPRHVLEHVVEDGLKAVKLLEPHLLGHLLVESHVLEPEWAVLGIDVEAFFADFECKVELTFSFFITRGFEEDWTICLALADKLTESLPCLFLVADSSLE